jgi:hypothetical protein
MQQTIQNFIEFDTTNFWENTVNPINTDSTFLQHGISDVEAIFNYLRLHPDDLWIIETFLKMNYLIKGEYFISHMSNIVLTNHRLFVWFNDLKVSIPLKKIIKYQPAKWDSGIKVEYYDNEAMQSFSLSNKWLLPETVNNALNKHKNFARTDEELCIAGSLKPTLQKMYSIDPNLSNSDTVPIKVQHQTASIHTPPIPQKKSYRNLVGVLFIVIWFGGCAYMMHGGDSSDSTPSGSIAGYKQCTIHNTTYSPNNVYGGCPKCVQEADAKRMGDALEKKLLTK